MKTQIKRFLLTLGFMTRIPVNVDLGEVKDEDMHKGFLYYPVVGLILGLCISSCKSYFTRSIWNPFCNACEPLSDRSLSLRRSFGYRRRNLLCKNERTYA